MKNKIILSIILWLCWSAANAQWPVNEGRQGPITGTIGEVRDPTKGRIHNGTDVIGNTATVYSIREDVIQTIGDNVSYIPNKYIEMTSGVRYTHVTINPGIAANQLQIQQINNRTVSIPITQRAAFATMIPAGNYPRLGGGTAVHAQHVHMSSGNENFLTNGFRVSGFTFTDNVRPLYNIQADSVKFFEDILKNNWNAPKEFNKRATDKDIPDNLQPIILFGNIDIVANTWQPGINADGTQNLSRHLAPKFLGYCMLNSKKDTVTNKLQNIAFNNGFGGGEVSAENPEVFKRIHSSNSTISNPFFIITNPFTNSISNEGNLSTNKYPDGDYTITVRSQGAGGTTTNGTGLTADKVCKVRLNNYKTYVKKVVVTDENGLEKYYAEWSSLTRPGDGSITLDKKNSEPFKSGTVVNIVVTTSEKVPFLNLSMPGVQVSGSSAANIKLDQADADGTEWSGTFIMPESSTKKVQLSFKADDELYGLILNQESADVKRDISGQFTDKQSFDKNHELKVCPADYPLTLEVNIENGQVVTLVASNGTGPYEYSMDLMPIAAHHKSDFGSTNTFTIDYDKNYLFKVRDAGGCQAEIYYTLPKVQCDALTVAGGEGTDRKNVNLGNIPGTVYVYYEMFTVPDQITIKYRDQEQTTGIVSGSGVLSFEHTPQAGLSNLLTITMYAPTPGTAWNYQVACPSTILARRATADITEIQPTLTYKKGTIYIDPPKNFGNEKVNVKYRVVGQENWNELTGVQLPYSLETKQKELEVKVVKQELAFSNKLQVSPNPAHGKVQIQYESEKDGMVEVAAIGQLGQQLMSKKLAVKKGKNTIYWQPAIGTNGLILIQVWQDGKSIQKKLIIEK